MIKTEKELAEAIEKGQETIEIEGCLSGKVAWIVAIGAISVAVVAVLATGGAATPASGIVAIGAVATLGLPVTITAMSIAVAAGGVGVLNKLRSYTIIEKNNNRVILKK